MSYIQQWRRVWATPLLLQATLFCIPLIDEFVSGIPVLTLPLARADLHISYAQVGLIFTVADLTGLLVNPMLDAISDHWSKPRLVLGGMIGLALGFALASSSASFNWLLLAFMLMGATNGAVVGLGGAILIDQAPNAALATTTRWVLLATIGDLLGPLLVAGTVALQGSWRLLMGSGALIWLAVAFFLSAQRFTTLQTKTTTEAEDQPLWRAISTNLRTGLRTPHLMRWLLLATLPSLLDEMFLGFAALFLTDKLGVAPQMVSLALVVPTLGGLLSLAWLGRWGNRLAPRHSLSIVAALTLVGLLGFMTAAHSWIALLALFIMGVGVAPWFPLAQAQALMALPGRSGTVGALQSLFAPIEIATPLLIGLIAERWGIQIGVSIFLIAPLLLLCLRPRPSGMSQQRSA